MPCSAKHCPVPSAVGVHCAACLLQQRLRRRPPDGNADRPDSTLMTCLVFACCFPHLAQVAMAENIDFNWPLKEACTKEIKKHCGGVEHGRGRVIRWVVAEAG